MARIQILPEILSNKIAAGEVVERPASVVKELVENAIDAGSNRIGIDIEQGGRALIRISDNGCGMNHDDALLAIERYATSKIATESDLFDIRTLGFRGEALPSIAAVSKFTLASRDAASDTATEIYVEGGRIKSVAPSGAPAGTQITVRQLFFNTPARRKFLKTIATEMGHIAETVSCIALSRPEIAFRLTHNHKLVKDWPAIKNPLDRITDVLGNDLNRRLFPVECASDALTLSGWVSDPAVTRSTTAKIYTFVNGRYIRDRGVVYATIDGYRGRLMKGRFPLAVLYLNLPANEVDINVHPTKHEVRFFQQQRVYAAIRQAVTACWQSASRATSIAAPLQQALPEMRQHADPVPAMVPDWAAPLPETKRPAVNDPDTAFSSAARSTVEPPPDRPASRTISTGGAQGFPASASSPSPAPEQPALFEGLDFASVSVIGQFHNTYILCEKGGELLLVDQHAAHERIVYERLCRARAESAAPAVQKLLLPETIELNYRESAALEPLLPELNALGIDIEPFGGNTFVVKAVPEALADTELKPLITELVETVVATGYAPGLADAIDKCVILMACHGAIRAHQKLNDAEMRALIAQLNGCDNPYNCPHGRPTLIRWPVHALEKRFKRIV